MTRPTGMELCLAAEDRLKAAGVEAAAGDATKLFLAALNRMPGRAVKQHHLAQHLMDTAPEQLIAEYRDMIAARAARQPVSQIVGVRSFWNHDFRVTKDTLDPRPDTEVLVEAALTQTWNSVLDLGTGTGAILISLLAERPTATGLGTDISDAALTIARENAEAIGVTAEFARADWYNGVSGAFDLIVSNPPYIALDEMAGLQPEVRDWEPRSALTDEADGLTAYRIIAAGAAAHLNPGGQVLVEIGWKQGPAVSEIFDHAGASAEILVDLNGHDRVIRAKFEETQP